MEGMDLSRTVRGEDGEVPEAAFMQGMGHTFQWEDGNEWRAARDEQYTYARWIGGEDLLFNNVEDPYQLHNLVDDPEHQSAYNRLSSFVDNKIDELGDPFKPTTWYRNRWINNRIILQSATREFNNGGSSDA
jgi:arylsulfatase A-like enzyme